MQAYLSGQPCLKATRASCYKEVKSQKLGSDGAPEKIKGELVPAMGRSWLPEGGKNILQLGEHPVDKAQWGLHQAEREKT